MSNELVALMPGVTAQRVEKTYIDQLEIMGSDDKGKGFFLTLEPDAQARLLAMLSEVGLRLAAVQISSWALRMTVNDAQEAVKRVQEAWMVRKRANKEGR